MKHEYTESALDALPEPEPPTVDWKAKFEALESQWVVAERAVDNVLQILPELKRSPSWEDAAALIREYIDSANARAEKAEAELAAAKESIESQTRVYRKDTEFLEKRLHEAIIKPSLSQLRPLSEAGAVPEGCLRFYTYKKDEKWTSASQFPCSQDTHFVEVRLPYLDPEYKPSTKLAEKPETFEAHGKIWTKHKPGDPMPCDGSSAVMALLGDGTYSTQLAEDWAWNNHYSKFDIVGWRYSDEPTPEPYADKPAPINDGGPAFPITENGLQGYNGMSLRDYFAGQALAGSDISTVMAEALKAGATSDEFSQILSMSVYKIADAMLAAREVKP